MQNQNNDINTILNIRVKNNSFRKYDSNWYDIKLFDLKNVIYLLYFSGKR